MFKLKTCRPCLVLTLALMLTLGLALQAQETSEQKTGASEILKIDTDLVMVEVTAFDKAGNYIRNLEPKDFRLLVDGVVKPIAFFSETQETTISRPLSVVFALDVSGSLKPEEIDTLRKAALQFTELMQGESVFAALGFNYEVKVWQDFTAEPRKLERAFAKIEHYGGSTRIYDALDKAVLMLSRRARFSKSNKPMRRVIVVITDGFDSSSMIESRELIRRANQAGVTVYSITLPSYILTASRSNERVITPLDATRIVAATGGRDFSADVKDFAPIFKALAEEIRASYGIAYYPDIRDSKPHEIRIEPVLPTVQLRTNRTTFTAPAK